MCRSFRGLMKRLSKGLKSALAARSRDFLRGRSRRAPHEGYSARKTGNPSLGPPFALLLRTRELRESLGFEGVFFVKNTDSSMSPTSPARVLFWAFAMFALPLAFILGFAQAAQAKPTFTRYAEAYRYAPGTIVIHAKSFTEPRRPCARASARSPLTAAFGC